MNIEGIRSSCDINLTPGQNIGGYQVPNQWNIILSTNGNETASCRSEHLYEQTPYWFRYFRTTIKQTSPNIHANVCQFNPFIDAAFRQWTLKFKVRSSVAGKYSVCIKNKPIGDCSCLLEYEIFEPNVWEEKILHIPACPKDLGTWRDWYDSIMIAFTASAGPNQIRSTPHAWSSEIYTIVNDQVQLPVNGTFDLSEVSSFYGWIYNPQNHIPNKLTDNSNSRILCDSFYAILPFSGNLYGLAGNEYNIMVPLHPHVFNSCQYTNPLITVVDAVYENCTLIRTQGWWFGNKTGINPITHATVIVKVTNTGSFMARGKVVIDRNVYRAV